MAWALISPTNAPRARAADANPAAGYTTALVPIDRNRSQAASDVGRLDRLAGQHLPNHTTLGQQRPGWKG